MTNADLRAAVVAKGLSREKKNQYTQGTKRTQVDSGWSDCSSFVRWCYLQILGRDIGGNTAAQITNKALTVVDSSCGKYPDESKLLTGDLFYYKRYRQVEALPGRTCRAVHRRRQAAGPWFRGWAYRQKHENLLHQPL